MFLSYSVQENIYLRDFVYLSFKVNLQRGSNWQHYFLSFERKHFQNETMNKIQYDLFKEYYTRQLIE